MSEITGKDEEIKENIMFTRFQNYINDKRNEKDIIRIIKNTIEDWTEFDKNSELSSFLYSLGIDENLFKVSTKKKKLKSGLYEIDLEMLLRLYYSRRVIMTYRKYKEHLLKGYIRIKDEREHLKSLPNSDLNLQLEKIPVFTKIDKKKENQYIGNFRVDDFDLFSIRNQDRENVFSTLYTLFKMNRNRLNNIVNGVEISEALADNLQKKPFHR